MIKRKLAAVCAAVMTVGVMSSAAVSAETAAAVPAAPKPASTSSSSGKAVDKAMTEAITNVKSRVKIPDSYSQFSYSVSRNKGMQSYSFSWEHPNYKDGGYSVTLTGEIITQYVKPGAYNDSGKASIGPYSADDYERLALDWINTANPQMKGQLRRSGNVYMSIGSDSVTVTFNRVNGGVAVSNTYDGNRVTVSLDKKTGEVKRMYANGWWQGAKFENPAGAMTSEQIFKIYSDEVKLKPWYRISRNKNKKVATIVYEPTEASPEYNAVTGEHSTREEDRRKLSNTDLYMDEETEEAIADDCDTERGAGMTEAAAVNPTANLSEEELNAVTELKGMLTAAKFKKLMIADPYIKVTDSYLTDSFNISKNDTAECGYMINCTFKIDNNKEYCSYRITADAKSGKVYSFYRNGGNESSDIISPAKASKLGTDAAKYYYGDIFKSYKADTENSAPARNYGNGRHETERSVLFYRYENSIQVDGDRISITVNSAGEVIRASFNHTTDVDFGDGKIISKETALSKLYEQRQPELSYMGFTDPKSNPHTYLTYKMPSWRINAKTGKLCNYDGSNYTEKAETAEVCPYTDIAASPYKSEIETLYNYGIRIFPGEKFDPKANVTSRELENIFNAMLGYGISYSYYDPYGDEVEIAVEADIDEDVTEDVPAGAVTNRQFAKRFVSKMRAEEYAKMKGIYRSPFSDVDSNDPDIGYICLAYGYGAVTGENGKMNPNAPVTREYAMHCVYTYIKKQS